MTDQLHALERLSRQAHDPCLVALGPRGVGGVDPLGLRQINFDLMNEVFPGLNNTARHIRVFTLVTWAWRRTMDLARQQNRELPRSTHEDFVARVEVAFVWSMLQRHPAADLDLPGKRPIAQLWGEAKRIRFGDDDWKAFVKSRRNSTSLIAAINYGPGLRALRLLDDDRNQPGARIPGPGVATMLDAFEKKLRPMLDHDLFRGWNPCSLSRKDAESWARHWDLYRPLAAERAAMSERLIGRRAAPARREGFDLLARSLEDWEEPDANDARLAMYEDDADDGAALRWRRLQVRQAFRLALEMLFEWTLDRIGGASLSTGRLVDALLAEFGGKAGPARRWLRARAAKDMSAIDAIQALQDAGPTGAGCAEAVMAALAVSLFAAPDLFDGSSRYERLPLARAAADFERLANEPVDLFLSHVFEQWVIAQHVYWAVGRGLADARSGGQPIRRLRLVLEPDGWRVTRGGGARRAPQVTPDRLRTAMSLAREAQIIDL